MKLSSAEFAQMYLKGNKNDKILLDVRKNDECAKGALPNCVIIPVQELEERYHELPKDKELFIYCAAGGRAEMAQVFLQHQGYSKIRVAAQCGYAELRKLIV